MQCEICGQPADRYTPGLCEHHATIGRVVLLKKGDGTRPQARMVFLPDVNAMLAQFGVVATQAELEHFLAGKEPGNENL